MNKIKVINKGYTLTVTSWENDGDNYKTCSKTYESRELAIAVANLCKTLFASSSNGGGGIGNLMDYDGEEASEIIVPYMKSHPELYPNKENPSDEKSDEKLVQICMDYNYELMGGSEYYYSRVFESATLTYSPEDVYLEEIPF